MAIDFSKLRIPPFGQPKNLNFLGDTCKDAEDKKIAPSLQMEVVRKFRRFLYNHGTELTLREKRILFWALLCEIDGLVPILWSPKEMNAALQIGPISFRMLRGLLIAYFDSYINLGKPWQEELGKRIQILLRQCESHRNSAQFWKMEGPGLVGPGGIAKAVQLIRRWGEDQAAWEKLMISLQSSFVQEAVISYVATICAQGQDTKISELLDFMETDFIQMDTRKRCISHLLTPYEQQRWREESESQKLLCGFCVRYLKDPRLSSSIRWQGIDQPKRQMVIRWLSIQDIHIFFSTVSMQSERKRFWLRYVPRIVYSRIALSSSLLFNPPPGLEMFIKENRHAVLKQAECAFIMQIGQFVVVEFSQHGNACYVYKLKNLPFSLDETSYSTHSLKNKELAHMWLTHGAGWQMKFDHALKDM